jgi:hypothetical protein
MSTGFLLTRERLAVTGVVAWAASNGDRSENADYQYGKRRPLALLTTVFHCFKGARRALYVLETTFLSKFESCALRHYLARTSL